jgi:farnesyl-diphosphate farnesyltransferase
MRIAYLVLRVSDYLEANTTLPAPAQAALLDAWAATLQGNPLGESLKHHLTATDDPSPDAQAAHHVGAILQALQGIDGPAQDVIRKHTVDSTIGMARWVRRGPDIETEADLDDYMHEVAGRVGYLITGLFSIASSTIRAREEEMMALGREFGLALQTVNIVRGIPSDIARGWFFVPRTFLDREDRTGEEFVAEGYRTDAQAVVGRLLDKADGHFQAAGRYVRMLPRLEGRMRYFCLLPYFFGLRTVALSRRNPLVLEAEVKLPREEVKTIAVRTRLMAWSNRWIQRYARELGT